MIYKFFFDIAKNSFSFIQMAIVLKCFLIFFYESVLFLLICAIKKWKQDFIPAQIGYYCWYLLILAVPLSYLDWNSFIKLPVYKLYESTSILEWKYIQLIIKLWFLASLYRLVSFLITNIRLEGAVALLDSTDIYDLKEKTAAVFGLNEKKIALVEAPFVSFPVTFGLFRKTIILPKGYQNQYSESELLYLILHEMAHIKNRDLEKLYLIRLINCFFLIPPYFMNQFQQDTEKLCDNSVLSALNAHDDILDDYSVLLIKECSKKDTSIHQLVFSYRIQDLPHRLDAIENYMPSKNFSTIFSVITLVGLSATFLWSYMVPDAWIKKIYPSNPPFYFYVTYDNQELLNESEEREIFEESFKKSGVMPDHLPDRPGRTEFAGTYQILNDGSICYDNYAICEILKGLELNGEKANAVFIFMPCYNFSGNLIDFYGESIQLSWLSFNDETSEYRYGFTKQPSYNFVNDKAIYFAAHWL